MGEQFPGSRPLIPVNIRDPRYSNIHLGGKGAWWNIAVHSGLHISLVRLRLTTFRCLPLLSLSRSFCVYIYSYIYNISIYILYRYLFHTQKSFRPDGIPSSFHRNRQNWAPLTSDAEELIQRAAEQWSSGGDIVWPTEGRGVFSSAVWSWLSLVVRWFGVFFSQFLFSG